MTAQPAADAFADPGRIAALSSRIAALAARLSAPVTFMEVCGTHTHAIAAAGLRRLLPANVRLIAGPGCPVCVTPVDYLDHALALAARPEVTVCTFGDLLRVPASRRHSLERQRAAGADVRVVYSSRDALAIAGAEPQRTVVFLAVGFETTAPTVAAALDEAERTGIGNFLVLMGCKTVEPPLRALLQDPELRLDGFLLPGHVAVVTGADAFGFLAEACGAAAAIVGFGPVDVQAGLAELLEQVLAARPRVANLYARVVSGPGNAPAQALLRRWFEPADTRWRGLGTMPASGLQLRAEWAHRDAARLPVELPPAEEPRGCRCGDVLRGRIAPAQCPLFAAACTPQHPVGACMVSGEGSCAASFRHERAAEVQP